MAIVSKKVFIATSAFMAFLDRANPKHVQAAAYFQYFAQEHQIILENGRGAYTSLIYDQIPMSVDARADQAASASAMSPSMAPPENSVSAMARTESGSTPESVSL